MGYNWSSAELGLSHIFLFVFNSSPCGGTDLSENYSSEKWGKEGFFSIGQFPDVRVTQSCGSAGTDLQDSIIQSWNNCL